VVAVGERCQRALGSGRSRSSGDPLCFYARACTHAIHGHACPPNLPNAASLFSQNILPGLFFVYDISPFQVTVTQHRPSLAELVTSLCAILGGVITAAGLVDAALFTLQKRLGVKSLGGLLNLLGDGHASMAAKVPGAAPPGVGVGGGSFGGAGGGVVSHTSPMHHHHAPAAAAYGGSGSGSPMPPTSGLGGGSPMQPAAAYGSPYSAPQAGGGYFQPSPPTSSAGQHTGGSPYGHAGPAAMPPHVS
jgi:hypothetical protein